MKRSISIVLFLSILAATPASHAQTDVAAVDELLIDILPDYDKASVLVLLTGTLPQDTRLPAKVTLPLPKFAQLNAIARIDGRDGRMKDDILSVPGPGTISFIIPDLRFRMEYYFPYSAKAKQRAFDYAWLADLSVAKFQLKVQEPVSAESFRTTPAAAEIARNGNGPTYHTFPAQAVAAGQRVSVHVNYTMAEKRLSIQNLPQPDVNSQEPKLSPKTSAEDGISWPVVAIIIGGIIIILAIMWQVIPRRALPASRKPIATANRQKPQEFCDTCGKTVDETDQYCSACGTQL